MIIDNLTISGVVLALAIGVILSYLIKRARSGKN